MQIAKAYPGTTALNEFGIFTQKASYRECSIRGCHLLLCPATCLYKTHREMVLICEFHSYWLAFTIMEVDIHTIRVEKESPILPSYRLCELQQWLAWQGMPTGIKVSLISVTNHFVIDFKTCSHTCHHDWGQSPMSRTARDSRRESITTVLLNECIIKQTSYLSLFSQNLSILIREASSYNRWCMT